MVEETECPRCHCILSYDEVDIEVGVQRENFYCPNCHWTPEDTMSRVKNWTQDAAIEVYDLTATRFNVGNIQEIIEKHCPFKRDTLYEPIEYFDDDKPCTCGGYEDGLHSRHCAKRNE